MTRLLAYRLLLLLALAGCGGGGGGGGGASQGLSVSPSTLTFSAANPQSERPASQTVTATLSDVSGSGTLFVRIEVTGPAVANVVDVTIISSTQGTATVIPQAPATLGPGTHTSVITVKMCTTDSTCSGQQLPGSPKTVNVTYTVGTMPPPPAAVAPSVGNSGVLGDVIIRGSGFTTGSVVMFGGTPAVATDVVSDTQIRAAHPPLTANTYPIQIVPPAGSPLLLGKSLTIVDAPAYASTSLAYPSAPELVRGMVYDPVAKALLVSLKHTNSATNQLLRYQFTTAWQSPTSVTLADLRDIALSTDRSTLFAVTEPALLELDPVALATLKSTSRPMNPSTDLERLKGLAVANDGNVVVTTGLSSCCTGHSRLYLYSPAASTLTLAQVVNVSFSSFYHAVAGAPANGAFVNILQGGLSPAQPVHRYDASSQTLVATSFPLSHWKLFGLQENTNVPAFDRVGSRMIAPDLNSSPFNYAVYDASFAQYGALPNATVAYAVAPDALRAYAMTIESGVCRVRAFDMASATAGSNTVLTEISSALFPATIGCPTSGAQDRWKMVVTPADDTAFIAGELGVAVVRLR